MGSFLPRFAARLSLLTTLLLCVQLAACAQTATPSSRWAATSAALLDPPPVKEQFRGLWVATVDNIDWPTTPGAPEAVQLAEIDAILDRAHDAGFNAIFLQVRPTADAVYRSEIEPASAFISGRQGLDPGYDPLDEWLQRAHARGMELHAWFNPFRSRHPKSIGTDSPSHINNRSPELIRTFGPYKWADPGETRARLHFLRVVADVLERYPIDGAHIDDYFYPYPIEGKTFDDKATYARYQSTGGRLSLADWRRSNTDSLVRDLYEMVKTADKSVTVSVSPFGIWRPGNPSGIKGMDAYDLIASDSRRWLREGWVDALMPQLYWPIAKPDQSFTALLGWWDKQNVLARHLWPGLNLTRTGPSFPQWLEQEIPQQVALLEHHNASGSAMFSAKILRNRPDFAEALATGPYASRAVVPDAPWLALSTPVISASVETSGSTDTLRARAKSDPIIWVVSRRQGSGRWTTEIHPGTEREFSLGAADRAVTIQGVYRSGNRSNRSAFERR